MSSDTQSGWAEIAPDRAVARQKGTWVLTYHGGATPLPEGTRIHIFPPFTHDASHSSQIRWVLGTVTIRSTLDAALSVRLVNRLNETPAAKIFPHYSIEAIEVTVERGEIRSGDAVEIVMGDTRDGGNPATAQWRSGPGMPFVVAVDAGTGQFTPLERSPLVRVDAGEPDLLRCRAVPSTVCVNEPFALRIHAEDQHTNPCDGYAGVIALDADAGVELPGRPAAGPERNVAAVIPGLTLSKPGTFRVRVSKGGLAGESNPVSTEYHHGNMGIFWGEIHGHCKITDGVGSPDEYYTFARDTAALDFASISEHRAGDAQWPALVEAARRYHAPGRFVTLPGYEWGWRPGHANIYAADDNFSYILENDKAELFEQIRAGRFLMIPHHTNDPLTPTFSEFKWDLFDKDLIRVAEICQMRGSFEKDEPGQDHVLFGGYGASIQDGLRKGFRFGFTGGTDTHVGRPSYPVYGFFTPGRRIPSGQSCNMANEHMDRTCAGLTAVFAQDLTRQAVFEALRARRVYATTGERILLDFRVNGLLMGEEGAFETPIRITARAAGTAEIETVTVVRNNVDVHTQSGNGRDIVLSWEDPAPAPGTFYYLRLRQTDGHMAWASPVWLD